MLHEVGQTDLCCANGKHPCQGLAWGLAKGLARGFAQRLVGYAIHELDLFSLDFRPLSAHRSEVWKCGRIK